MDETRGFRRLGAAREVVLGIIPCWTGCGTSGAMTSGVPAGRALDRFSHFLNAITSGYGCQDDCCVEGTPGGTGSDSEDAPQPVSRCLREREKYIQNSQAKEPRMGRICFHFHRQTRGSSGRRSRHRINPGCPTMKNWGPSNDTPTLDQSIRKHGPPVPLLPCRSPWDPKTKRSAAATQNKKTKKREKQVQQQVKCAHA